MSILQTPGKNTDLDADQQAKWDAQLQRVFADSIAAGRPGDVDPWFVAAIPEADAPASTADIDWTAFPKTRPGQYAEVDADRRLQDEYCEWAVAGPPTAITAITFSTETPDYFSFLFDQAPDVLLSLYRQHVSPDVQQEDLVAEKGGYDVANAWNVGRAPGRIMHMAQENNFLQAAAILASMASWPVVTPAPESRAVTDEQELTACLQFGVETRHSDPHIGAQVNALVRAGNRVTLADPPGLYIHRIILDDFETPDGSSIGDWVDYDDTRGVDGFRTRVVFRAPAEGSYTVSDLTVGGQPVRSGGQIADNIRIRVRGLALPTEDAPLEPIVCDGGEEAHEHGFAAPMHLTRRR